MFNRKNIALALAVVLVAGFAIIVYRGRPVMKLAADQSPAAVSAGQNNTPAEAGRSASAMSFSMAQVAGHNQPSDCWSAINGQVYDLTGWISRHPGGPEAIIGLCGADGSAAFNGQHGRSQKAQAALVLLKIGSLTN